MDLPKTYVSCSICVQNIHKQIGQSMKFRS